MEEKIRQWLQSRFGDDILQEDNFRGQQTFYIKPEAIYPICQALYDEDDLDCKYLVDICSDDWLGHEAEKGGRFEVIYCLYSLTHKYRFWLKLFLPADNPEVASLTPIYNGANWMEREVWDMMGIKFTGHPNLSKILTADELEGHPLRKDFPLTWEVPHFSWNKDQPPEVIK